jgi:GMP synthase (glutamine-hydrolysing)
MRRILLYKTGETAPELVREVGDYFMWFKRLVDGAAELKLHLAFREPRPDPAGLDGILVTGSPCSLVNPEPWMEEAAEFVREAAGAGLPILGVCFGHQLIGRAFGGQVRINPKGWEAGTTKVQLTDEGRRDPLFDGVPETLEVNQSHRDEVCPLGEGVRQLAQGSHCENQSIAVGEHVRGVQFHPEMTGLVVKRIIKHRESILATDAAARGRDDSALAPALIAKSGDTPVAEKILGNFVNHFVKHA